MLFHNKLIVTTLKYINYYILILNVFINNARCLNCYICGPPEAGFKQNCDRFYENSSQFIETCNEQQSSCSTQMNADIVTRQCEEFKLDDCKVANGVKYCYCATELCNGIISTTMVSLTDDEDMLDGSGTEKLDEFTTTPITTTMRITTHITPHSKSISNKFDGCLPTIISLMVYGKMLVD